MATQASEGGKQAAETEKQSATSLRRAAAAEDFQEQIEVLRAEVAKLAEQIARSGDVSLGAMRKAAAAGVDQLKAQGEAAVEGLRSNAHDLEGQLAAAVREKPVTALALAAGAGFLFALLSRR